MPDGSDTCGEPSITSREVESLCDMPETKRTLCANCTLIFKNVRETLKKAKKSAVSGNCFDIQ